MISKTDIKNYYSNQLESTNNNLKEIKSKIKTIGFARLLLILVPVVIWLTMDVNNPIFLISLAIAIILFLALVKRHDYYFRKKQYLEKKVINFENELRGLDSDYSNFDGGTEYINSKHAFSYDLDLFGNKSLFQIINRTINKKGKDNLKDRFLNPLQNKESIIYTQDAVKELSKNPDLLFHFITTGHLSDNQSDITALSNHFSDSKSLSKSSWKYAFILLPVLLAGVIIAYYLGLVPASLVVLVYFLIIFLSAIPSIFTKKKIGNLQHKLLTLSNYVSLLQIIENEKFNAKQLIQQQRQLQSNAQSASKTIKELEELSNNLLQSQNILGIFILNPILLWNVIYTIKLEKWFRKNEAYILECMNTLSNFDSLVSLSIYTFNHPCYVFPTITDTQLCLEGKAIGHPLMSETSCVRNNISISNNPQFMIVTGANMAGKSTYLRTVSTNLLLAEMGIPVFADEFVCYPFSLITNLRTSDSLTDNESYFFAELKKLKQIIDKLEAGKKLFIVLDEILKGTNSEDKQKGSIALVQQLLKHNAYGIIATHDLILGQLETEYPGIIKNFRFEAEIINEDLYFSYKLKTGVAQNMNACFLMKKMGIAGIES